MGGLYNILCGYNPACYYILPMLGRKAEDYPRFRDCFISENNTIVVYTRVGGGNRNCGFGEEALYKDENFLQTWDDEYDNTYGYYEFKVPDKWKKDFDLLNNEQPTEVSDEYKELLKSFYPKINYEDTLKK